MTGLRRRLGVGFLVASGTTLLLAVAWTATRTGRLGPGAAVGGLAALCLVSTRLWLPRSGLSDGAIWRVAVHGGVGLGLFALAEVALLIGRSAGAPLGPGVVVASRAVALGGVVGVVVGCLVEGSRALARLEDRNAILRRLLRHDLRNDANVVLGHAREIAAEGDPDSRRRAERIVDAAESLVSLGTEARRLQRESDAEHRHHRLGPAVDRAVEAAAGVVPRCEIETDVPPGTTVAATADLDRLVAGLVVVAAERGAPEPDVRVRVDPPTSLSGRVALRVQHLGPGLPAGALETLVGSETPLSHGDGARLWTVRRRLEAIEAPVTVRPLPGGGREVVVSLQRSRPVEAVSDLLARAGDT